MQQSQVREKMQPSQIEKNQEVNKLMFDCLDIDGSGTISFKEYEILLKALGETNEESIKRGFENMDLNKNGSRSRDEYAKIRSGYFSSDDPEYASRLFYGSF
ncbi:MAG: EF-hand domain-containing protein [Okeania sp. SIO2G4]|uniref:EF-hand domain-containing protein n=2 Tax=Okeania TaxID=1458928 RepID=UPI0013BCB8FF|nr:EF-hand domain-containing protein [Okeania sp. SIO2G4]NEP08623.1 EF-hand domain-containing protein [Okeania sp. SIO4D6]NEP43159.1 EF-hand domain-containing protein [Okeania sp. SIO2H7]NEP97278.1 EF-hand domain-containing protein [Okeania sp. SIO2F5]NEQ95004.1 EF-hand domain-containing protein [Okeania sp. SIO2G4]